MPIVNPKPEILAPVGNWEMCLAAVHNGADAIYVGTPGFNARGRAETFSLETLREMIEYCHLFGVKVFLAFNVLIFEQEIETVHDLLRDILPLKPDALIVQDIGLVRLIKQIAPNQEVHASTQMTVTSDDAIRCTADLEMSRYVLGREVSIAEMQRIKEGTDKELEVFVHGALCVSYSGQCLTSESLGGRSANRGQCAQSCRLPYELIVDGERRELGDKRYLVSPQDLCALEDVPRLVAAGIESFKIEGRLKSPEYVASVVRAYRNKVDGKQAVAVDDLKVIYSRDFFNGWMDGVNHQRLVRADFSSHLGLELGSVSACNGRVVEVESTREIQPGEGVVFCDFSTQEKIGGPVFAAKKQGKRLMLEFSRGLELRKIRPGMKVFLSSSPELAARMRRSFTDKEEFKKVRLNVRLSGAAGAALMAEVTDALGNSASSKSELTLQIARGSALNVDIVREEFSKLGGTCFELGDLNLELAPNLFLPHRELKHLRQRVTQELMEVRAGRRGSLVLKPRVDVERWIAAQQAVVSSRDVAKLNVLLRDPAQIDALRGLKIDTVYLDFEHGKDYEQALQAVRALGFRVGIATTRILKPREHGHLIHLRRLKPDCALVRNLGALDFLRESGVELVGDFSLNVTNSLTGAWMLGKGLSRITPSYDLNREQVTELLGALDAARCEVTVHQYMPAFHMEHCVFAAFLSKGSSYRDCGRPCEQHRVELRGQNGALHPLKADAECRNTMFNGVPQSAARLIPQLKAHGVGAFRLEALFETAEQLRHKAELYAQLISDDAVSESIFERLAVEEKYGVSEGQLVNIRVYQDRKKAEVARPPQVLNF